MNVAALFLNAIDPRTDYLPYVFKGDWSEEEKQEILDVILGYCPSQVDAMFNAWIFNKYSTGYYADRATWNLGGISAKNLAEFKTKLDMYYNK